MKSKHLFMVLSVLIMMIMSVSVVSAQPPQDFDIQQVISALAPRSGSDLLLDLLLYGIFGLGFIAMLLVPDKQMFPSLIMVGVIGASIIAKLDFFGPTEFATFLVNVSMLVGPIFVAAMVRDPSNRGRRPKALVPAALTGVLGGLYFLIFWALKQSGM